MNARMNIPSNRKVGSVLSNGVGIGNGVNAMTPAKLKSRLGAMRDSASTAIGKPPVKLYEAAATIALLTGAALEGAGLALNEAIKERKLNVRDAKSIVNKLAASGQQTGGQWGGQWGGQTGTRPGGIPLNLPPGVELATDTILNVAEKAKTIVGDGLEIAAKKTYEVGSQLLDDAVDAVVPVELLDKPYGELNPELSAKLSAIAANMKAVANDPEARAAIGNLAKASADVGIEAINAAMPNINRLVDRVWTVANNVGAKSVRSAMNVGMAMLVTALSEVPVVGGMVVGGLEAGTIFNNVVETGSKAVQGFTEIAKDSMSTMSAVASSVGSQEQKLVAPIQQVKDVYGKYSGAVSSMTRGGGRGGRKTRRRRASIGGERARIERRLRKSLKAFFGGG